MRSKQVALGFVLMVVFPFVAQGQHTGTHCRQGVIEGEVAAGHSFVRPVGDGLQLHLNPLPSGWILRVLPTTGPKPSHDYAELATPPYRSVSPLLISTDFSFRAQDAVGWNVRRFRFASSQATFQELLRTYQHYESDPSQASQQQLAVLVSRAPQGSLTILDAKLVPGIGDQPRTASILASHFSETAHTIEKPVGASTPLGRLNWIRFRIALDLPYGFAADRRLAVRPVMCAQ